MIPEIDQKLDSEGLPRYSEAIAVLESLAKSAGQCKDIDQHQVFKAWAILDRYRTNLVT